MFTPTRTSRSNIISQLGLDKDTNRSSDSESDGRREARQVEFIELMIRAKRKKLIRSVSSRIDQMAEDQITTATYINDLRLREAASNMIAIATKMAERRAQPQRKLKAPYSTSQSSSRSFSTCSQPKSPRMLMLSSPSSPSSKPKSRFISTSPCTSKSQYRTTQPVRKPTLRPSHQDQVTEPRYAQPVQRRPTELPYDELRKHPDFKRLSWSWTGVIVGVPVLIVTSWVMWKDYNRRMMERKLGLGISSSDSTAINSKDRPTD